LPFLTLTAFIGGGFAAAILLLRAPVVQVALSRVLPRVPDFATTKMPVPYGVPIAIAGILMVPSLAFLA
jgi:Flp pilus assembly protein protease CpaA